MTIRLNKITRDLNIGISTIVEFLKNKGYTVEANPNTKITDEQYNLLISEFGADKQMRQQALSKLKVVGKIDLDALNRQVVPKGKNKPYVKRENLTKPNILFHVIVIDANPLADEDCIRLSYNKEGYYAQISTLLYNKHTSILFSTIEEESQDCSLYRILDRIKIVDLFIPENDFLIIEGDYKYQLLLEKLFDSIPANFSIYNKIRKIHLQLLYSGKKYIEDIKWSDSNRLLIFALKTKPFVILSGLSGTGKSCKVVDLAKSFYNLSEQFQNRYTPNYNLQSVKPNWFDSTELLGYISPNTQKFVDTEFLEFVRLAESHPNTPYFVCLDEMNLARVEYYFAELLSKVEMRFFNSDGKYESVCISTISPYKYTFPANLFIIGTVNMDDTTNSFSRKVLDRAMVFETPIPDLKQDFSLEYAKPMDTQYYSSDILLKDNIDIKTAYERLGEYGETLVDFLIECNEILKTTPFGFAYRLRNESLLYCYHNFKVKDKPLDWFNVCLDEILRMKILPRIEGDRSEINDCLIKLETLCDGHHLYTAKEKISEMLTKFNVFGYTSYFN